MGGGTIFQFYGGDTAVMRGDIEPQVPPTRENPGYSRRVKVFILPPPLKTKIAGRSKTGKWKLIRINTNLRIVSCNAMYMKRAEFL